MIFLLSILGLAAADCTVENMGVDVSSDKAQWVRTDTWRVSVQTGWPSCREFHLRTASDMEIASVKAVIVQPDDTKTKLGSQRLVAQPAARTARSHILELPELRSRDRMLLEVTRTGTDRQPLEFSEAWWTDPSGGHGAVAEPAPHRIVRTRQAITFEMPPGQPLRAGPGSSGFSTTELAQEFMVSGPEVTHWAPIPPGAELLECTGSMSNGQKLQAEDEGQGCWFSGALEGEGTLNTRMTYRVQGIPAAGIIPMNGAHTLTLKGAGFVFHVDGPSAASVPDGYRFSQDAGDAVASWRIAQGGGVAVLPDRRSVVHQIAAGALTASMPEPGLGLRFKGREAGWDVVGEVLRKVRGQVVEGRLSSAHPLKPRKLTEVRRSRWGTPWEQALLLTRYLRQLKVDALPVPVRPASHGKVEPGVPEGYTQAVVRVRFKGTEKWIDPACGVCAVGEVRPGLWQGQVLSAELEALPQAPDVPRWAVTSQDAQVYTLKMTAPWSVSLRRALALKPIDQRKGAIMGWLGVQGALKAHQGLSELGAPVTLRFSVPDASAEEVARALKLRQANP